MTGIGAGKRFLVVASNRRSPPEGERRRESQRDSLENVCKAKTRLHAARARYDLRRLGGESAHTSEQNNTLSSSADVITDAHKTLPCTGHLQTLHVCQCGSAPTAGAGGLSWPQHAKRTTGARAPRRAGADVIQHKTLRAQALSRDQRASPLPKHRMCSHLAP